MSYDSRIDTYKHIAVVRRFMLKAIQNLQARSEAHDLSKLESPEKEVFDEFTPKLAESTYGSEEYKSFLAEMKPALDHHYAANSHHPEHFGYMECDICFHRYSRNYDSNCVACFNGSMTLRPDVSAMSLLDILEMLCDWKAAALRHNDGDILKSIEINQKRFGYSDELKHILLNTVRELGLEPETGERAHTS